MKKKKKNERALKYESQLKLVRIYHSSCFWLKIVIAINVNRICSRKTGSNLKKFSKAIFINDFSGKMLGKFEEKSPKTERNLFC